MRHPVEALLRRGEKETEAQEEIDQRVCLLLSPHRSLLFAWLIDRDGTCLLACLRACLLACFDE